MIELLGGIVIGGVAGVALKDKLVGKQGKDADDYRDDLEDEIDSTRKELKSIRLQNEELIRKVKEYKYTCEAQEAEISFLKEKLG